MLSTIRERRWLSLILCMITSAHAKNQHTWSIPTSKSAFQSTHFTNSKPTITKQLVDSSRFHEQNFNVRVSPGTYMRLDQKDGLSSKEITNEADNVRLILLEAPLESQTEKGQFESQKSKSTTGPLALGGMVTLSTIAILAYLGFLPLTGEGVAVYTNSLILRDFFATISLTVVSGIFVKSVTLASKNGYLEPRDSRKIIHSLSAPLFVFCWPLFSNLSAARYFAAVVPFLNAVRLFIAGSGRSFGGMHGFKLFGYYYVFLSKFSHSLFQPADHFDELNTYR